MPEYLAVSFTSNDIMAQKANPATAQIAAIRAMRLGEIEWLAP